MLKETKPSLRLTMKAKCGSAMCVGRTKKKEMTRDKFPLKLIERVVRELKDVLTNNDYSTHTKPQRDLDAIIADVVSFFLFFLIFLAVT